MDESVMVLCISQGAAPTQAGGNKNAKNRPIGADGSVIEF
jgi:hypothetical protein